MRCIKQASSSGLELFSIQCGPGGSNFDVLSEPVTNVGSQVNQNLPCGKASGVYAQ